MKKNLMEPQIEWMNETGNQPCETPEIGVIKKNLRIVQSFVFPMNYAINQKKRKYEKTYLKDTIRIGAFHDLCRENKNKSTTLMTFDVWPCFSKPVYKVSIGFSCF